MKTVYVVMVRWTVIGVFSTRKSAERLARRTRRMETRNVKSEAFGLRVHIQKHTVDAEEV